MSIARVVNLGRALDILSRKGFWIIGAAGESPHSLFDFDWIRDVVLGASGMKAWGSVLRSGTNAMNSSAFQDQEPWIPLMSPLLQALFFLRSCAREGLSEGETRQSAFRNKGLNERAQGQPTTFVYDPVIPSTMNAPIP